MTTTQRIPMDPLTTETNGPIVQPGPGVAWKIGQFILHLLEMLVAMGAGMAVFHLLVNLIRATSNYDALLASGTTLHSIGMTAFMTVPMVVWMVIRGHGWRHSVEMGIAMDAPMAAVGLLCQLGVDTYLPWLAEASCPAMFLGMLAAMLYRRDHYTGTAGHSAHAASTVGEPACHAG